MACEHFPIAVILERAQCAYNVVLLKSLSKFSIWIHFQFDVSVRSYSITHILGIGPSTANFGVLLVRPIVDYR